MIRRFRGNAGDMMASDDASRGEPPVTIPLAGLAEGDPRAQSNFETADRAQDS